MDAGALDRRVCILKRRLQTGEAGEQQEVFDAQPAIWAKFIPMTGREYFQSDQVHEEETARFQIRYREDITTRDRIEYRDVQYNIVHIGEIGRREGLELLGVQAPH